VNSATHIIIALVCFGPIALIVLFGTLMVPMWFAMLEVAGTANIQGAESHYWSIVSSIGFVLGGIFGLFGVIWITFLSVSGRKPRGLRNLTRMLVGVGLLTLVGFNLLFPVILHPFEAFGGFLIYCLLPVLGSVYFLRVQKDYIGFARGDHD